MEITQAQAELLLWMVDTDLGVYTMDTFMGGKTILGQGAVTRSARSTRRRCGSSRRWVYCGTCPRTVTRSLTTAVPCTAS
jgi:hypothetical protein